MEMYCCDRKNPIKMMITLRCGELMEADISINQKQTYQDLDKK